MIQHLTVVDGGECRSERDDPRWGMATARDCYAVVRAIARGFVRPEAIAVGTGLSRRKVEHLLRELERAALVQERDGGEYAVTPTAI